MAHGEGREKLPESLLVDVVVRGADGPVTLNLQQFLDHPERARLQVLSVEPRRPTALVEHLHLLKDGAVHAVVSGSKTLPRGSVPLPTGGVLDLGALEAYLDRAVWTPLLAVEPNRLQVMGALLTAGIVAFGGATIDRFTRPDWLANLEGMVNEGSAINAHGAQFAADTATAVISLLVTLHYMISNVHWMRVYLRSGEVDDSKLVLSDPE